MGQMGQLTTAEKAKDKRLRDVYNTTLEEQNAKREQQRNACAICRRPFSQFAAFQDHDHKCCARHRKESLNRFCGKCNRGLICFLCNKKYVPMVERMLKDHVDPADVTKYIRDWTAEITLKGGYGEKPKTKSKATSRRKQKSVRRRATSTPANRPPTDKALSRNQHRVGRWTPTRSRSTNDRRFLGGRIPRGQSRVSARRATQKVPHSVHTLR